MVDRVLVLQGKGGRPLYSSAVAMEITATEIFLWLQLVSGSKLEGHLEMVRLILLVFNLIILTALWHLNNNACTIHLRP